MVGDSVKREIKEVFMKHEVPEYLNQTLIT